jgi:hypothetical protein
VRTALADHRLPIVPFLGALLVAGTLVGYTAVQEGLASSGAPVVQQAQEFVDEIWDETEESGKEEMVAQRPEREQIQLDREEGELETASDPEAASTDSASEG